MLNALEELVHPHSGDVISIYSNPMAGKTLLALNIAREYVLADRPVYYLDTEGGAEEMAQAWEQRLPGMKKIPITVKHSLEAVTGTFGQPMCVEISDKGKAGILPGLDDQRKKNKPIDMVKAVLKGDGLVVIDSMTSPIRGSLPMVQQSFPARASIMALWFQSIYELIDAVGKGMVWITHHSTYNPADRYQTNRGDIQGGSSVVYYSKKILALESPPKKILREKGFRKVWAVRSPFWIAETESRWIKIDDNGIKDATPDIVQRVIDGEDETEVKA